MDVKEIISKNIAGLRKKAMLTQVELADQLNYSDKAISKRERGESLPDAEMLYKIAQFFSVDISYLFEEHTYEALTEQEDKKLRKKALIIKIMIAFSLSVMPLIILSVVISAVSEYINIPNLALGITLIVLGGFATFLLCFNIFFKYKRYLLFLSSAALWSYLLGCYFLLLRKHLFIFLLMGIIIQIFIIFAPKLKQYIDYEIKESDITHKKTK